MKMRHIAGMRIIQEILIKQKIFRTRVLSLCPYIHTIVYNWLLQTASLFIFIWSAQVAYRKQLQVEVACIFRIIKRQVQKPEGRGTKM
jgi:hypothetical protein